MTTTAPQIHQSTALPARRAADSGLSGYLERVTAADEFLRAAKTAKTKIARGRQVVKDGQGDLAAAMYGMNQAGVSIAQIARDLELSESHVRNEIKMETLRRRSDSN